MSSKQPIRKPRALRRGDRIGLVAPSSPFSEDALRRGIGFLEAQGFHVSCEPNLTERRRGFLAGDDEQRAEELVRMFEDPEIDAVFVVRGGYGAQRILERLDQGAISRNPKIFLGYSDVTVLLAFLVDRCGLACFHGPLVIEMGSLSARTQGGLFRALTVPDPIGRISLADGRWIRRGSARGTLVGGNLSVLCSTLGTPWEIETSGRILLLEDRGEQPYRVDRMLVQMKQAGKLSGVRGLVFGDFLMGTEGERPVGEGEEFFEVLSEHTRDLGVPVLCGLPVGHGRENLTLPVGVDVEIEADGEGFSVLESGVE